MKPISTPQVYTPVQWRLVVLMVMILGCAGNSSLAFTSSGNVLVPARSEIQETGDLPVIITPLRGYYSDGVAHLYWKSLQETNSNYFEIERSTDGINYITVGRVMARGVSDKEVEYKFADIKADAGFNYYRLKQVDKDGETHFSNIELLNISIKGINITGIYPAPFTSQVNVTISSEVKTGSSILLFDNTGKLIIKQQAYLNQGVTNLTVDNLGHLARGLYIIKVQAGETVLIKKLIK